MLGWHITVNRIGSDNNASERDLAVPTETDETLQLFESRPEEVAEGPQLAQWQAAVAGIHWLHSLVTSGHAVARSNSGYPDRYLVRAIDALPLIGEPPHANKVWRHDPDDVIDRDSWPGKTTLDEEQRALVDPQDWLLVTAWDES